MSVEVLEMYASEGGVWVKVPIGEKTVYEAGAGLTELSNIIDAVAKDEIATHGINSILVETDWLSVQDGGITTAKLADLSVTNIKLGATIGGLTNVNISADTPVQSGYLLAWNGTEWVAASPTLLAGPMAGEGLSDITTPGSIDVVAVPLGGMKINPDDIEIDRAQVDQWYALVDHYLTGPPVSGDILIWNPALGTPPGTGAWEPVNAAESGYVPVTRSILVGMGLKGGGPLIQDVSIWMDLGPGIIHDPGGTGITINVDNATLEINANDILQIKDAGVTDIKLGAQLGALTNVEMVSTKLGGTQTDGAILAYDIADGIWKGMPGFGAIPKIIDSLDDVDTSTVPPVVDQALCWDPAAVDATGLVGQWIPAGPHLKLSGGVMVNEATGGIGIDMSNAPITNIRYNPGGPLATTGLIVLPEYASSIQYVDDLITVGVVAPVDTVDIPKRDGLLWVVKGLPEPNAFAISNTSASTNLISWVEPSAAGEQINEMYTSSAGAWLPVQMGAEVEPEVYIQATIPPPSTVGVIWADLSQVS